MDPTLGCCLRRFLNRIQSSQKKFPQHFRCFRRFLCYVASHFYRIQKGQDKKQLIDPEFKIGGQRNWIQVLSNSGIASVLVIALWVLTEGKDYCLSFKDSPLITTIIGGVIGHYCCCNGDTWTSEIGILSDDRPRLITTFKHVRKGINGGVTKSRTSSSCRWWKCYRTIIFAFRTFNNQV